MFKHPKDDWIIYLFGAVFALFLKWHYHVAYNAPAMTRWQATKDWFSIKSREEQVSWATTIGVVWVLGSVYIDRAHFLWDWLEAIPVVQSIAFLLGTLTEYIAPNAVKWVLSKLPTTL